MVMNSNINISSSRNDHVDISDKRDISDKMEAKEDKSTCTIKHMAAGWKPTSYTISPLTKAEPPISVKQLRSWLGSYKQMTNCINNYAALLGPLENIIGGRASAEKIVWTEELIKIFNKAKSSLKNVKTIYVPQTNRRAPYLQ